MVVGWCGGGGGGQKCAFQAPVPPPVARCVGWCVLCWWLCTKVPSEWREYNATEYAGRAKELPLTQHDEWEIRAEGTFRGGSEGSDNVVVLFAVQ